MEDGPGQNAGNVNLWVIVLPVTGIILVGLFTVFCVCRYTCRFISFCTKQCEKSHRSNKPVVITMPSHQDIQELMMRESSPFIDSKAVTPTAPVDEEKGLLLTPVKYSNRLSTSQPAIDTSSAHNYNNPLSETTQRHKISKKKISVVERDEGASVRLVSSAADLNITSSSLSDITSCANNEISEITAPCAVISTSG